MVHHCGTFDMKLLDLQIFKRLRSDIRSDLARKLDEQMALSFAESFAMRNTSLLPKKHIEHRDLQAPTSTRDHQLLAFTRESSLESGKWKTSSAAGNPCRLFAPQRASGAAPRLRKDSARSNKYLRIQYHKLSVSWPEY